MHFILIFFISGFNNYVNFINNFKSYYSFENDFLFSGMLLILYFVIEILLNLVRNKFFNATIENIVKNIEKNKLETVIESLELEGKSHRIWGPAYSMAYKEIICILKKLQKIKLDETLKAKARTETITNSSHDIKTPLTSVLNYIDILQNEKISQMEREKFTQNLKERSEVLSKLISNLSYSIDLSQEVVELNLEDLNIEEVIDETIVAFKGKLDEKALSIQKINNYGEGSLKLDRIMTNRIFQNVLDNIIKYGERNTTINIILSKFSDNESGDRYLEIHIKNISKERINLKGEELLERFKRGDEARSTQGSGLGLNIVKSIMELQGGKVEINIEDLLFSLKLYFKSELK